jgi:hypothetical protein
MKNKGHNDDNILLNAKWCWNGDLDKICITK